MHTLLHTLSINHWTQGDNDTTTTSTTTMEETSNNNTTTTINDNDDTNKMIRLDQVRRLVHYLQLTDQLVIETQLRPMKERAYPIQQYHQGSSTELVQWSGSDDDYDDYDDDKQPLDIHALKSILKSKSVCAWGECYR